MEDSSNPAAEVGEVVWSEVSRMMGVEETSKMPGRLESNLYGLGLGR